MPYVRIGEGMRKVLRAALATYLNEVVEIVSAVESAANFARLPPDSYVPKQATLERNHAAALIEALGDPESSESLAFPGREIPSYLLQLMRSALSLYRDDLEARYRVAVADPLMPVQAREALKARLDSVAQDIASFWTEVGDSPVLSEVRTFRVLRSGPVFPRRLPFESVPRNGEGQEIELKVGFPTQAHDLASEVAAFATSNPGTIYTGVADDGTVVGLPGLDEPGGRDKLRLRVECICANSVSPAIVTQVGFESYESRVVLVVAVPKGSQPVYHSNQRPYVRHATTSRPANPQEIIDLVRRYLARQGQQSLD